MEREVTPLEVDGFIERSVPAATFDTARVLPHSRWAMHSDGNVVLNNEVVLDKVVWTSSCWH